MFERVMAVNVTANWRLIRSLDPLLRRSDAGRAIFVTSGIANKARALLERLRREQGGRSTCWPPPTPPRSRTPPCGSTSNNPGPMRTNMRAQAFPGEPAEQQVPPEAHGEGLIQLALPSCTLNGQWIAGDSGRYLDAFGLTSGRLWMPTLGDAVDRTVDAELEERGVLPSPTLGSARAAPRASCSGTPRTPGRGRRRRAAAAPWEAAPCTGRRRRRPGQIVVQRAQARPAAGRCRAIRHCVRSARYR